MGETAQPFWKEFVREKEVIKEVPIPLSPYNMTSLKEYSYEALSPNFIVNFNSDNNYPALFFKSTSGTSYAITNITHKQYLPNVTWVCTKFKTLPVGMYYFPNNDFYIALVASRTPNFSVIYKLSSGATVPSYVVDPSSTFTVLKAPEGYTDNFANAYLHFVFAAAINTTFKILTAGKVGAELASVQNYMLTSSGFSKYISANKFTGTLVVNEPGVSFFIQISSLTPISPDTGDAILGETFKFTSLPD